MTPQIKSPRRDSGAGADTNTQFVRNCTTSDITYQFRQAMQGADIHYSGEIIPDGKLHRFYIDGQKRGSLNGAYLLHSDGCPAGWFMDYKTGISQTWRMSGARDMYASCRTDAEIDKAKRERDEEIRQKHAGAAIKAAYIWSKSKPIAKQSEHAYLVNKRIQPHNARLYGDALVIPLCNESDALVNLQFINSQGEKRFLSGGRKRGCFYILGDLSERILIAEGLSTGASLYENTGQRTVIAFDAGNLLPVSKNIRELAPDTEIIICGDHDLSGVGQTKAREAALAIGAKLLIPPVAGDDWNDVISGGRHDS